MNSSDFEDAEAIVLLIGFLTAEELDSVEIVYPNPDALQNENDHVVYVRRWPQSGEPGEPCPGWEITHDAVEQKPFYGKSIHECLVRGAVECGRLEFKSDLVQKLFVNRVKYVWYGLDSTPINHEFVPRMSNPELCGYVVNWNHNSPSSDCDYCNKTEDEHV